MNKTEFKKFMIKGHGRCARVLETKNNIERYKDTVLWGCLHGLPYNVQMEGTHASYLYRLSEAFGDSEYFLAPVIAAFGKLTPKSRVEFFHFADLLSEFKKGGSDAAGAALSEKYEGLLSLLTKKRRVRGYDYEVDAFEKLSVNLIYSDGESGILRAVSDMGRIFGENPRYNCFEFDYFCFACEEELGERGFASLLRKEAKKNGNVRCFYESYLKFSEYSLEGIEKIISGTLSAEDVISEIGEKGKLSAITRVKFARRANNGEMLKLAGAVLGEENLYKKAELLSVFSTAGRGFPLSHGAIIEYAHSDDERLAAVARDTLKDCISGEVQKYALSLLEEGMYTDSALLTLIPNYSEDIKEFLLEQIYKLKVDAEESSLWHRVDVSILHTLELGARLPKEFFLYVYETTLCSDCRERAVRALAKKRALTPEMIEECRKDKNPMISQYVNRYYKTV